jgi:pyruvate dehydrogenase E2 component (dihydrolipoamide acetyltransferase)
VQAKEGKLKPEDYTGGTFAVSNLGMFGVTSFCPIINPPQAAILGAGMTAPKVVMDKDGSPKKVPSSGRHVLYTA